MANKTHGTRQKLTFRLAPARPRNPLVVPARQRAAGRHEKSAGATRSAAKRQIKKLLEDE